jgi:Mn2+/Fe2+ NRAMP family transporter
MISIQMLSARIGFVTGNGLGHNLARLCPRWLTVLLVGLLVVANTINIAADIGAMGEAVRLLAGGPHAVYVMAFGVLCIVAQIAFSYERSVRILKWLTLTLFAYVAVVLSVKLSFSDFWSQSLRPWAFLPAGGTAGDYASLVVAVLGTTITPYCFFWQSSQEAEDERIDPAAHTLLEAPGEAPAELARMRFDTYTGMGYSNVISLFIIVSTAATLHAHGITDIQTSAQAAEALRPIAGVFTFALFAIGIIGIGLLAVPVLAGASAYALGETLGWTTGLDRQPREAKAFYGTIAASTLVGILVNFVGIDPIRALFWSAVINGVVAVPLMVMIMIMARQREVMGRFVLPRRLWAMGWLSTGTMAVAVATMFALW